MGRGFKYMDLRERLRSLGAPNRGDSPQRKKKGIPIHEVVTGTYRDTPFGPSFVSERRFHTSLICDFMDICAWLASEPGESISWISKDECLASMDIDKYVFMDTETTGLAGGTGTWVFLVGLGFFEGEHFKVEQHFLADYDEEMAFLSSVSSVLDNFQGIVTFNGKSFDVPLIETRFQLAGGSFKTSLADLPHLDLLHCARRLWKVRLQDCSLDSLETNILGIYRENDVPGSIIPSLYFRYLQEEDAGYMGGVFRHNLQDVVSLLGLMAKMCHVVRDPFKAGVKEPADLYSLAKLYEELGLEQKAVSTYLAVSDDSSSYIRWDAAKRLSFLYKRMGLMKEAVEIWEAQIQEGSELMLYPFVELAKYYEHKVGDYEKAKSFTEAAMDVARRRRGPDREMEELAIRLERLLKKNAKRG